MKLLIRIHLSGISGRPMEDTQVRDSQQMTHSFIKEHDNLLSLDMLPWGEISNVRNYAIVKVIENNNNNRLLNYIIGTDIVLQTAHDRRTLEQVE